MTRSPRPEISVLIPVFNAADWIDTSIRSVREQTVSDLEIVAVDDASTDESWKKLQDWVERDERIRAIRNEENLGMTRNWNRCLQFARGEYVLKLDADDLLKPHALEVLLRASRRSEMIGVGMRALRVDRELRPLGLQPAEEHMRRAGIDPEQDHDLPSEVWFPLALGGVQLWHSCAFVVGTERLRKLGGWDEHFGCASDTEILLRLLEQEGLFGHRSYVGLLYRQIEGSVSAGFRASDLLRWESIVLELKYLSRDRQRRGTTRRLRQRYALLWERWIGRDRQVDGVLPGLLEVMREVPPPSRLDMLFHSGSSFLRGFRR